MAWVIDPYGDETAALAKIVDFRGLRILEVGAGEGRLTWRYAQQAAAVLGIDPDEERIAQARADLPAELGDRVRFEVADAVDVHEPAGSFDLAFLSWSL